MPIDDDDDDVVVVRVSCSHAYISLYPDRRGPSARDTQ